MLFIASVTLFPQILLAGVASAPSLLVPVTDVVVATMARTSLAPMSRQSTARPLCLGIGVIAVRRRLKVGGPEPSASLELRSEESIVNAILEGVEHATLLDCADGQGLQS